MAGNPVVLAVLQTVVSDLARQTGRDSLDIVDAGGGTGGFAVPLAVLGHSVTVVDPSPDSLAAAQRRAAEQNVPLRAVQGDAADLAVLAGDKSADLVLCHSVLEYVDSPAAAMAAIAAVLRPGGAVSVLAASAVAAVIHRGLAGPVRRGAAAARPGSAAMPVTATAGGPAEGPGACPRRFTLAGRHRPDRAGRAAPGPALGVRVFADLVPRRRRRRRPRRGPGAAAAWSWRWPRTPAFHDFAAQVHVLGYR